MHNDAEHAIASLRRGAYGYLGKPLRLPALQRTVTEAFARYDDEQDMARQGQALARHDRLTGLLNKAEFGRRLEQRLQEIPAGAAYGAVYLKLDGSFIANLPRNPNDQVFVRAMVEISRVFGLKVIAEWVEDRETAEMLRGFGVAYGQSYYFGKAEPLSA